MRPFMSSASYIRSNSAASRESGRPTSAADGGEDAGDTGTEASGAGDARSEAWAKAGMGSAADGA